MTAAITVPMAFSIVNKKVGEATSDSLQWVLGGKRSLVSITDQARSQVTDIFLIIILIQQVLLETTHVALRDLSGTKCLFLFYIYVTTYGI